MLALVFSHTMCLQSLGAHWRFFSLPPAAFLLLSEGSLCNLPAGSVAHPIKAMQQRFAWMCPGAQEGGLG